MIKILLADDHNLLIDGLRSLLERQKNIEIVGIAKDGLEAVELAAKYHPDIILLDISMPRLNGLDAARKIIRDLPNTKIIILSMHADRKYIQESIRIGARGYILKESAVGEVIEAIKEIQKGELFFCRSVRDQVLHEYIELIRNKDNTSFSPLSVREREVLQLLAEGKSTKDTASILNVSVKTVESHRKQVMDKLGLHSIAELTKYAIREGLTQLE
ncbi:MAG: response regulator transcription factor [Candidatus Zixiibacteriota bacterium]